MRVIGGSARGRKLFSPEGMAIRPTANKIKEAVFNIIQFDIASSSVLDLFAGSGQLGIEAVSRGAAKVIFVDSSKKSIETIKKNISLCKFSGFTETIFSDAFLFLGKCREKFDIIFLDPPYRGELCSKALGMLSSVISEKTVVICETQSNAVLPEEVKKLKVYRQYNYSAVKLTVYRASE